MKKVVILTTMCLSLLVVYFLHRNGLNFNTFITSTELFVVSLISGEIWNYINNHRN